MSVVQNGYTILFHEFLKTDLNKDFMNWADYLNADSDATVFD